MARSDIPDPEFPPVVQYIVVMWSVEEHRWMCMSGPMAPTTVGTSLDYFRHTYPGQDIRTMIATTSYGMGQPD